MVTQKCALFNTHRQKNVAYLYGPLWQGQEKTMKREPQNDLRYIKTERLIQETFREMLRDMDYAQITIKELTERAMINRKTFYLHYSSLDELLAALQTQLYHKILESTCGLSLPKDFGRIIREMFLFIEHTDPIGQKILDSQGNYPYEKSPASHTNKMLFHRYETDSALFKYTPSERKIIDAYVDGSVSNIYSQWVADGKKIPIERMIALTTQLIAYGLSALQTTEDSPAASDTENSGDDDRSVVL